LSGRTADGWLEKGETRIVAYKYWVSTMYEDKTRSHTVVDALEPHPASRDIVKYEALIVIIHSYRSSVIIHSLPFHMLHRYPSPYPS
jgi:hypothetical protein